jgi:hypothetical protein
MAGKMSDASNPVRVQLVTDSKEIQKQLVLISLSLAAAVAVVWIQRKMSGPDVFLTTKMRLLVVVQNYADERAKFWNDVSAQASKVYLDSRV